MKGRITAVIIWPRVSVRRGLIVSDVGVTRSHWCRLTATHAAAGRASICTAPLSCLHLAAGPLQLKRSLSRTSSSQRGSLSLWLSVSISLLSISLTLSLSVCLSVSLSLSLCLTLPLSVCLSTCLSVCLSDLSVFLSVSVSLLSVN